MQKMTVAGLGRAMAAVECSVVGGHGRAQQLLDWHLKLQCRTEVWDSHQPTDSVVCDESPRNQGGRERSLKQNVWVPSQGSWPGG